ncbi:MAG TPA: class I SAM-dependent methyltransferase [Solirubrobacteraceae bacterium]|jgi:ubiquinone/menaquinone biosynthesis C-methylase UbiE|nr:class I SAM-dependent methyltransferase [Solirubrobacteraceae bacterium]
MHNLLCSSGWWSRRVETELLPWGLEGADLGDDVLELGPGFGATTRVLAGRLPGLTALELDPGYCRRLRAVLRDRVDVTEGDATQLPFEDGRFSGVVCFTMLHHITPAASQDMAFREVARVLGRGGMFAGTDSIGNGRLFKLIHIGDTLNLLDPATLPARLEGAGLANVTVDRRGRSMRFRALKPA